MSSGVCMGIDDQSPAEAVFFAALGLTTAAERADYLERACGADKALRRRVDALLAAHPHVGRFLERPVAEAEGVAAPDGVERPADDAAADLSFLDPPSGPGSLGRIGHYEILEVLGRGGFGIVLRASDDKLQRVVAVKVLAPQLAASSPARKRFLREARSSARVRHENVVQVYAVEEHPLPYLVMEYVAGETLQKRLDRTGPLEVAEVLRIGRQVAEGLAAAHATGLVHRDIKPANILIGAGPEPCAKITDFGMARAADDASLTQSGLLAGTPMYMAPEQAHGQALDHRADLFSLGSVLYTMCSGRPPFRASGTLAVLKRVAEDTPRPIPEVISGVPQWLCDAIARLHAKKPHERLATAREVADLLARPPSSEAPTPANDSVRRAPTGNAVARALRPTARRWAAAGAAALLLTAGLSLTEAAGVTHVRGTVVRLLFPAGMLVVEVDDPAVSVAVNGDELVVTGAGAKEIRLKTGRHKVEATRDGKVVYQELVTVTRDGRQVVRITTGPVPSAIHGPTPPLRPIVLAPTRTLSRHTGGALAVAFAPNGKVFASAGQDRTILLWDVGSPQPRGPLAGHAGDVIRLVFSPDSTRLASVTSAGDTCCVRLWDVGTATPAGTLGEASAGMWAVDWSSDGTLLTCGGFDKVVRVWDVATGEQRRAFPNDAPECVRSLAFSPRADRIVTGGGGPTRLWDVNTGAEIAAAFPDVYLNPAYLPSGDAVACWQYRAGRVTLCDVPSGRVRASWRAHPNLIHGLAVSADGRFVATVGDDGAARVWSVADQTEVATLLGHRGAVHAAAFSPDGALLTTAGSDDGTVRLWDLPTVCRITR